jgi:hypothetical protein
VEDSLSAQMAEPENEGNQWDHLNNLNWRGLGLTDPIKNVEVRPALPYFLTTTQNGRNRTSGYFSQLF